MKTTAVVAAVATALALTFSSTDAAQCSGASLALKFLPILGDSNYKLCQSDSGYTFYPFKGLPDDAQLAKLCGSAACHKLLTRIQGMNLPSCDITYDGVTYNLKETVDTVTTRCPATL